MLTQMKLEAMKKDINTAFIALCVVFSGLFFVVPASVGAAEPGYSKSELGQPPAEEMIITPKGEVKEVPAQIVPELKKIDINRIGSAPSYETFLGQRMANYFPAKYFTIAQRVEIYQEPRPIDAYVMDAKKIRWLHFNQPWNNPADYRSQITPIFTRAYGTEITMSDPRWPEAMIRYTLDYRDIYQNQFPIYRYNPTAVTAFTGRDVPYTQNTNYKHEQWDQNDILWMYAKQIPGINWYFSANFGYRYSTMSAKNDGITNSYYENRQTYYSYFSIAPSDRCEWFGQVEYYKSKRPKATFDFNPDHYFYAAELRMKSRDKKTSVIPRMSYSIDYYHPFRNTFEKYEMQIRVGHDFTPKLNATSTFRCNLSVRNESDNQAPIYNGTFGRRFIGLPVGPGSNPVHDMAGWVGVENRAQYNFYDRLWLQGGLDLAAGTNMNDFDNMGFLTGFEYYAPGLIRVDFGYRGNYYYNVQDYLTSIYFKVYLFM